MAQARPAVPPPPPGFELMPPPAGYEVVPPPEGYEPKGNLGPDDTAPRQPALSQRYAPTEPPPGFEIMAPGKGKPGSGDPQAMRDALEQKAWEATDPGFWQSAAYGLGHGFFGLNDEITAGLKTGFGLWGDFNSELGRQRSIMDESRRHHPIGAAAGEAVGSMLTPYAAARSGATVVGRSASLLRNMLGGAIEGGLYGGLYGAGATNGTMLDRARGALEGAAPGAGFGTAAAGIGHGAQIAVDNILGGRLARPLPGQNPLENWQAGQRMGVPLTEGQITRNPRQLRNEADMRSGARGDAAANITRDFERQQLGQLGDAATQLRERFAGSFPAAGGDMEVGQAVAAGARRKAQELRAAQQQAYRESAAKGVTILPQAMRDLGIEMRDRLAGTNFKFDQVLHPNAFSALEEIGNLGRQLSSRGQGNVSSFGVSLQDIDTVAQRINKLVPRDRSDAAALAIVKREFDGWLDDAVNNELFTGSREGLDLLKQGRALTRQLRSMTNPKTGDDAGRVIRNMISRDTTGQEVANWLYGANIAAPTGTSVRVATRLKVEFGAESPEWGAIRQGAWRRLVGDGDNPQAIAKAIREFTTGKGRPLAETLFTPAELATMKNFAFVAGSVSPAVVAAGGKGLQRLRPFATALAGTLGFGVGGVPGAVATIASTPAVRSAASARAAARATAPERKLFRDPQRVQRLTTQALTAVGDSWVPRFTTGRIF